jgi:hypothetical protein
VLQLIHRTQHQCHHIIGTLSLISLSNRRTKLDTTSLSKVSGWNGKMAALRDYRRDETSIEIEFSFSAGNTNGLIARTKPKRLESNHSTDGHSMNCPWWVRQPFFPKPDLSP